MPVLAPVFVRGDSCYLWQLYPRLGHAGVEGDGVKFIVYFHGKTGFL